MIKLKTSLIIFLLICLNGFPAFAAGQKMMSIQVKKGELRSTPSFLGIIVARLSYGDRVYVREERGHWVRVGLPGNNREGWTHTSVLTSKKIVLNPGAKDVQTSASGDELALAGKGFSKQVENEFKGKNPKINYAWIDRMEKFVVSQKQSKQFLKEGELSPEGGF
jgi:hypothetical protein